MLKTFLRLLPGLGLILGAWALGNWLTARFNLPLPAAMTGLCLLFALFTFLPRTATLTSPAADLMLRFLPLFLYPFGAGFLDLPEIPVSAQIKLGVVILASLVSAMLAAVFLFHKLRRHDS